MPRFQWLFCARGQFFGVGNLGLKGNGIILNRFFKPLWPTSVQTLDLNPACM